MVNIPLDPSPSVTPSVQAIPDQNAPHPRELNQAFGGNLGSSLGQLGSTIDNVQQADGKAQALAATTDADLKMQQGVQQLQDSAAPGAPGFQDQVRQLHSQVYGDAISSLPTDFTGNPNKYALQAIQQHQMLSSKTFASQAQVYQAQAMNEQQVSNTTTALDNMQKSISIMDPTVADSQLPMLQAKYNDTVNSLMLPQKMKQKLIDQGNFGLSTSILQPMIQNDPDTFLSKVSHTQSSSQATPAGNGTNFDTGVTGAINSAASKYNADPDILTKTASLETGGNAGAVNPYSGASGLFQFTPSTASQYGLTNPQDPVQAANAAAKLQNSNAIALTDSLGRKPTGPELYLAHQQGAAGASELINNPDDNAIDTLTDVYGSRAKAQKAITQNGGTSDMTSQQFIDHWTQKYNAAPGSTTVQGSDGNDSMEGGAAPNPQTMSIGDPVKTGINAFDNLNYEDQQKVIQQAQQVSRKQAIGLQSDWQNSFKNAESEAQNGIQTAGADLTLDRAKQTWKDPDLAQQHYNDAQQAVTWGQSMHNAITMTPAQQQLALQQQAPQPGDENYAAQDNMYQNLQSAIAKGNQIRQKDPRQFAEDNGLADPTPLNLNDTNTLVSQLQQRQSDAITIGSKYQLPALPFSNATAQDLTAKLQGMPAAQQASVLEDIGDGLSDPNVFRTGMSQIAKGNPVMAMAASFMNADKVQVSNPDYESAGLLSRTFGNIPATVGVDGQQAAILALRGQALIKPNAAEKQDAGTSKPFPMPSDNMDSGKPGLRNTFDLAAGANSSTNEGGIFGGRPDGYDQAYQTYKSVYAALASDASNYSGTVDPAIATKAAKIALGDVSTVNGKAVAPPWGMSASNFNDSAQTIYNTTIAPNIPGAPKWGGVQLINMDTPGKYMIRVGSSTLASKGASVILDINAPIAKGAMQHAAPVAPISADTEDDSSAGGSE